MRGVGRIKGYQGNFAFMAARTDVRPDRTVRTRFVSRYLREVVIREITGPWTSGARSRAGLACAAVWR